MKSFSFAKALTLGCFACLLLPVACGDDDDSSPPPPATGGTAGTGGAAGGAAGEGGAAPAPIVIPGTSDSSKTTQCGVECDSTPTALKTLFIDPCCAGAAKDSCGVSSGFLLALGTDLKGACLPKDEPGELDAACPSSPASDVMLNGIPVKVTGFPGCCRAATGTCGFVVDDIKTNVIPIFTSPDLGCVDSAAFGVPGKACGGGGGGGGGGAGGNGGADAGGASVGGADAGGNGGATP